MRDRDPEELSYLQEKGITPGTALTVDEIAPIGMMTVRLPDGETVSVPDAIAEAIRVRPPGEEVEDANGLV